MLQQDKAKKAYSDSVAEQYKKWIYPKPIFDLELWHNDGNAIITDPSIYNSVYWPYNKKTSIKILVAGCGANEAAIYAFNNPESTVYGIDISHESLKHQQFLKKKYNLENLFLKKCAIEDAGELNEIFDLIISNGVLHHMNSPEKALKNLKLKLSNDGVIAIMVYAQYGRSGVYMLQEIAKLLRLEQNSFDISLMRNIVARLSAIYPSYSVLKAFKDLSFDSGVVDLLLHTRDKPYTVNNVLSLVDSADLKIQDWIFRGLYDPLFYFEKQNQLYKIFSKFSIEKQWAMMELVNGNIHKHAVVLCRNTKPETEYVINFERINIENLVPTLINSCLTKPIRRFPLKQEMINIISKFDQKITLAEAVEKANLKGFADENIKYIKDTIQAMYRLGTINIGIK